MIKVNYRGDGPSIAGNEDIVAVYRELLKTFKPKSIGMFGASGGCTLAQTTMLRRKLRNAGVEADLNVFEGMWHYFWEDPGLPELREAMIALANLFNRHLD